MGQDRAATFLIWGVFAIALCAFAAAIILPLTPFILDLRCHG